MTREVLLELVPTSDLIAELASRGDAFLAGLVLNMDGQRKQEVLHVSGNKQSCLDLIISLNCELVGIKATSKTPK